MAFAPDGKTLASASTDNTIRQWDAQTGMSVATFKGPSSFSKGLAFSPRSKTLASGHAEGRIYLIDARPAP